MFLTKKEIKETKDQIIDIVKSSVKGTNQKVIVEGNVIKGIVPKMTNRVSIIKDIEKKLNTDQILVNSKAIKVTLQTSVRIKDKTISSGSRVLKIHIKNTNPEEILAITIKPGTAQVSLLPNDLGISGEMSYPEYKRRVKAAINALPELKVPNDFKLFLHDVFNSALNENTAKVPKMPDRLNAYVMDEVLADISKAFSEVLGPALVNKYNCQKFPSKRMQNKIKTIIFPAGKTTTGYDFGIMTVSGKLTNYSVKSAVAKITNTIKPNDIDKLLLNNFDKNNVSNAVKEYKAQPDAMNARNVISILADEKSPTDGAFQAAEYIKNPKPKQFQRTTRKKVRPSMDLKDSINTLQKKQLDFNSLLSIACKDELSFLKYELKKDGSSETTIIFGKQIKELEKKLNLRSKGIKQGPKGEKLDEKLGVTPP